MKAPAFPIKHEIWSPETLKFQAVSYNLTQRPNPKLILSYYKKKKKTPNTTSFSLHDGAQYSFQMPDSVRLLLVLCQRSSIPSQLPKSTRPALLADSASPHQVREEMEMRQLSVSWWFYPHRRRTNDVRHKLRKRKDNFRIIF